MLSAGGIFAKCYIAQAERSSDGTQSQKICLTNLYAAHYNMSKNACLQGHFCEMLYSAGLAVRKEHVSAKICLSNLYCAHYTTKSPFCQEFFEQKFYCFAKSTSKRRLFVNLYTKIVNTVLKHFLYLYTKHHALSKHSLKFFFKFIHMLSEKRRIGFGALQRTPRLDIHRRFIKIIHLRPSKR